MLDLDEMLNRFRERANAVKNRPLPPVAGSDRTHFINQAKMDFQDFAMIADCEAKLEDGILTLKLDLRKKD